MTNAFNRERSNHQTFIVQHPTTEAIFASVGSTTSAGQAHSLLGTTPPFFSAYKVAPELIPKLEARLSESFANTLSNKKMEKFSVVRVTHGLTKSWTVHIRSTSFLAFRQRMHRQKSEPNLFDPIPTCMDAIFTLPYSEYAAANILADAFKPSQGYSVFVPCLPH